LVNFAGSLSTRARRKRSVASDDMQFIFPFLQRHMFMKTLIAIASVACMTAVPAYPAEGQISNLALARMGLGSMATVSDDQGLNIRGLGIASVIGNGQWGNGSGSGQSYGDQGYGGKGSDNQGYGNDGYGKGSSGKDNKGDCSNGKCSLGKGSCEKSGCQDVCGKGTCGKGSGCQTACQSCSQCDHSSCGSYGCSGSSCCNQISSACHVVATAAIGGTARH
jgi:hypothetical protein